MSFFLKRRYNKLGREITKALKQELTAQGHVARGTLRDSIRSEVKTNKDGENTLVIRANKKWRAVNEGQPAGLNLSEQQIKTWLSAKGINWRSYKFMIYQINKAIFEQGTPTKGSFRYSKNGRRTGFVDEVANKFRLKMMKETREAVTLDFRSRFEKAIDKVVAKNKNLKKK